MSLKTAMMGGASVGALETIPVAQRRVWRVKLLDRELKACGFDAGDENAWEQLKGMLKLKGLPESYLGDGMDFRAKQHPWGLTLEFV